MSFIEGIKKKFLGEETGVMKATDGGKRIGVMGKATGGNYVKSEHGVGFDASTYRDAGPAPRGKVGSVEDFRSVTGGGSKKSLGKEVFDYVAPKAKAAGKWMQDRGMELNGDKPRKRPSPYKKGSKADKQFMTGYNNGMAAQGKPAWESRGTIISGGAAYEETRPRRKASGRVPRGSQPPGYDGSFDMFGVGNFGIGPEREEYDEPPRRRKKSRRRAAPRKREDGGGGFADMNYIPEHMRHMF